jgi:hypothetical protein
MRFRDIAIVFTMVSLTACACSSLNQRTSDKTVANALRVAIAHDLNMVRRYYPIRHIALDPRFGARCGVDICVGSKMPSAVLKYSADSLKMSVTKRESHIDCTLATGCRLVGTDRITILCEPLIRGDTFFIPVILEQRADRGEAGILRNGFTYVLINDQSAFRVLPGARDIWTATH